MSKHFRTDPATQLPGIDYRFRDPGLLARALTHRSHGGPHYERLEFLGDALLNCVVAELLYRRRPHAPEGDLSRLRSRLVRDSTLAEIASDLNLGEHVQLGVGELRSGGHQRASILADVLESVIGAIYLDAGFEAVRTIVLQLFDQREQALPSAERLKDPKTRLQELLQADGQALPEYRVVGESGADHCKRFEVECSIGGLVEPVRAEAGSRRKAEQAAARLMHEQLTQSRQAS